MKKKILRLTALLLAAVLLSGCEYVDFKGYFQGLSQVLTETREETEAAPEQDYVAFSDMEYSRPDLQELDAILEETLAAAQEGSIREVMDGVYCFYDAYDWFYTCYSLADIRYSGDLTDSYWEREYNFCVESSAAVDASLEELYYGLAQSPSREKLEDPKFFGPDFFTGYDGENRWDDAFTALLDREGELQSKYYTLSQQAAEYEPGTTELYDACGQDMAQLLVDLIAVRQEIAAYWGYDDYSRFAWDFYYYRDFSPEEVVVYLEDIRQELVPVYCRTADSDVWDSIYSYCSEADTLDYLRQMAGNMGGTVWEAFQRMEQAELYDIRYSEKKYNSSFELYLTSYGEPFVFMNPDLWNYDCLTLAHEFGHFCNDYACRGSYADVDVSEIYSQGMEYLSLKYTDKGEALTRGKLADSLAVYVEQAAYAEFEQRMYGLTGADLSVQGLCELYEEVVLGYGFDTVGYDPREFVEINHYYTNPMYIISYVLSNDSAMQLYQLELEQEGAGLALFQEQLSSREESLMAFLESAGLESPFVPGRMKQIRQIFEEALG